MPGHPNFDALASTTLKNYVPKLEDNASSGVFLWKELKDNGSVTPYDGGDKIVQPLLYGQNNTVKTYVAYETLDLTPQEGITAAEFPTRNHAVTVAISGPEEDANKGEEKLIDLLDAKVQQAEMTVREDFEVMLSGNGQGVGGRAGKDFAGIRALIGDNLSTITVVGGIDAAAAGNEFWRSYVDRTAGVFTITRAHHAINMASRGTEKPKFGITTMALYEKYESLLQPQQRFTNPKTGEAGFENLLIKSATLSYGDAIETGAMYFLNAKYLKLRTHKSRWMHTTPFVRPANVDAKYAQIISRGNLTISNRKLGGSKLEGQTV